MDFLKGAEDFISKIAPKLGYDGVTTAEKLEGRDIALIIYATENGYAYGYDTAYLVFKGKDNNLKVLRIVDTSATKKYLVCRKIEADDDKISVVLDGEEYQFDISSF